MGKRAIAVFIMVVVLMLEIHTVVFAEGEFEYKVSDETVAVVGYKGNYEKAEIPGKTDDGEVTVILSGAFKGNENLKSVVIPESIVKIAEKAFEDCKNLKDVYYRGSLESWKKIRVAENGNESFLSAELHFDNEDGGIFENEFFSYRVNSDNEVTIIMCKRKYEKDTKITFPSRIEDKTVVGIEDSAFENCGNVSEIKFEEGIRYIGAKAFRGCTELKKIDFPNSLERIGSNAFTDTEIYRNSPDGSVYIDGWYCGYKGDTSKEVDILIQRHTKGIADFAFYKNEDAVNVFFTKGIKYIGSGAFSECRNLSGIFFEGTKKEWEEIKISSGNDSISEKKIRYNTTIDNYWVGIYKGLCMTLLIITGILLAVLIYCIARIIVQERVITELDEELNRKAVADEKKMVQARKPVQRKAPVQNKRPAPKKRN